jgi:hypothetical protein
MSNPDHKAWPGRRLIVLRALITAIALAALVVSNVVARTPSDPFKGVWTSIDTDGSNQTVSFGGGRDTRAVHYFDDGASACGWPDINVTATLTGMGEVSGTSLTVDVAGQCNGTGQLLSSTIAFTYDSSTDTLLDSFGVTWYR